MNIEKFIGCSIEDLIARKRNSFSRNVVLQNSDIRTHKELIHLAFENKSNQVIGYLFAYKNLTIHAIDEKQSPIPFKILEETYKNAVFSLQYLKIKNAYVLTLFRNTENESDLTPFFNNTYFPGKSLKENYIVKSLDSFLDFGHVKCAMSLSKSYGIQDLLDVAWNRLLQYANVEDIVAKKNGEIGFYPIKAVRFIFSVEHPELSTITLFGDNDLQLVGKTQIMKDGIGKISAALEVLKRFDVNRFNKI